MQKLKVTWLSGSWTPDPDQNEPVATAEIAASAKVRHIGEETLAFERSSGGEILLVVPANRLVSAVLVEVDN